MTRDLMLRQLRRFGGLTLITGLVVSFQNCAPGPQNSLCPKGQVCTVDEASSAAGAGKAPNSAGGTGGGSGGSSGGFGPSGGGSGGSGGSGGGGTGGGGWDPGGGGGSGGGGTGGGGTGGGGGGDPLNPGPVAFSFYQNLASNKVVMEGSDFTLEVMVQGGEFPYTYQWYRNNTKLTDYAATFQHYGAVADRFSIEGNYHVVVKDKTGASIKSNTLNLSFQIPIVGCAKGKYTANGGNPLSGYGVRPISELYENSRGKYLIPTTHPDIAPFAGSLAYYGFFVRNFESGYDFGDKINLPCGYLPRITENAPAQCKHSGGYCHNHTVSGTIQVVCENKKFRVLKHTCNWTYNGSDGGGP